MEDGNSTKVNAEYKTFGPAEARLLLAGNIGNRPPRVRQVKDLTAEMKAGRWRRTPEPIVISSRGEVRDGQHRLMAIVASDTEQEFLVIVSDDPVHGRTVMRTGGDYLWMRGVKNANALAATLGWIEFVEDGYKNIRRGPPYGPRLDGLLDRWPEVEAAVSRLQSERRRFAHLRSASFAAALAMFMRVDAEAADAFIRDLAEGTGLDASDPVYRLRERLLQGGKTVLKQDYVFAITIKAWNQRIKGVPVRALRVRQVGDQAEAFPLVAGLNLPLR